MTQMWNWKKTALAGGTIVALLVGAYRADFAPLAWAAGFYTNGLPPAGGTQYPSTLPLTGAETIPADTNLASGQNPQSESISVSQLSLATAEQAAPRNYIDNGAMAISQQGTGIITCGTNTAPTATAFAADRWFCDVNVAVGAGRSQVTTSTPTPPAGFQNSVRLYRTSGALLQQVCVMQAIESSRSVQLAGKNVVFSAYLQALAGMSGLGQVNVYIITGTGTDQGFGTLTASPAITPAWTGIAGGVTPAATFTLPVTTPSWTRYNTPAVTIAAGVTEIGVEACFTPAAAGAGVTDGFAMTGAQLEPVLQTANAGPSPFEFFPIATDLQKVQRFFWQLNEPANGAAVNGFGQATGAATTSWTLWLPQQMRGTTPVIAIPTTGTFKTNIAGTPTTWVTPTAGVCSVLACTITGGNTNTAGQAETLTGGGGTGVVTVANDVIM